MFPVHRAIFRLWSDLKRSDQTVRPVDHCNVWTSQTWYQITLLRFFWMGLGSGECSLFNDLSLFAVSLGEQFLMSHDCCNAFVFKVKLLHPEYEGTRVFETVGSFSSNNLVIFLKVWMYDKTAARTSDINYCFSVMFLKETPFWDVLDVLNIECDLTGTRVFLLASQKNVFSTLYSSELLTACWMQ